MVEYVPVKSDVQMADCGVHEWTYALLPSPIPDQRGGFAFMHVRVCRQNNCGHVETYFQGKWVSADSWMAIDEVSSNEVGQ